MTAHLPIFNGQNPVFIPGPTNIPDRLRYAMSIQTTDHRAPDFVELLGPLLEDLKKIFKTETGHIITFPSTGTGGWEASITNTLSPGDKVLVARFGMFSRRWIDLCQRHNLDVEIIECEWGEGAPADLYQERLAADINHEIKAVLVTHNETATGVRSDVSAIRAAMDAVNHPAMLYVDCVSSLACMDFQMDEWGVDLAVSGSQKGFMLAAGMAIIGVSEKALAAMDSAKCPRCFFDFRDMAGANASGGFPYGGTVVECEPSTSSREAVFAEVVAKSGADFIHPYNDPRVIAGQATCSKEMIEDVGPLDAIVAPIGGGGMISGTCLTLSSLSPNTKIYAAEPKNADDAYRSFKAGHIIADDAPETVADGLKVPLKDLTWYFVSNHVTDIFTATEEEIVDAMYLIWQRMKIVMEPSSAVAVATILNNPEIFANKRVGVIITGGNVDLNKLPWFSV